MTCRHMQSARELQQLDNWSVNPEIRMAYVPKDPRALTVLCGAALRRQSSPTSWMTLKPTCSPSRAIRRTSGPGSIRPDLAFGRAAVGPGEQVVLAADSDGGMARSTMLPVQHDRAPDNSTAAFVSLCHSTNHPGIRAAARVPGSLVQAAITRPSSENMNTPSMPFARRKVSSAWTGVCAIGPPTLKDVFTATSTPIRLPSAFK
jgi:hypothetical protein